MAKKSTELVLTFRSKQATKANVDEVSRQAKSAGAIVVERIFNDISASKDSLLSRLFVIEVPSNKKAKAVMAAIGQHKAVLEVKFPPTRSVAADRSLSQA